MKTQTASLTVSTPSRDADGYETLLAEIETVFYANGNAPLFTTDATNLWEAFLSNIPAEARQHYTCNSCRHFVERFGGLVTISPSGKKESAMWHIVPDFFTDAVDAMCKLVEKAKVTGVFVSSATVYGDPITGEWRHMSVEAPAAHIWKSLVKTASQEAAEKLEDYKMLTSAMLDYKRGTVDQALKLLRSDSLYRSEKVLGVAEWLKELLDRRAAANTTSARNNITWLAVSIAPAGFCHVKSTMIGTLLDDIEAGMDFEDVSKRFASKMHPLQYQRPQAAPSAGNIAQAEKIVEQLGAAGSLERRFARLDELKLLWSPAPRKETKSGGVFGHLKPKDSAKETKEVDAPIMKITWEKFSRTVLPDALSIEYLVSGSANFAAVTTAEREDAPPILQWDSPEKRNPFSGYVYHGGTQPSGWNLSAGWVKVTGISLHPSMWQTVFDHHAKSVLFVLEGAKDSRYRTSGSAIFPETLKSEFHSIRASIEAYSKSATLGGYEEASACGIRGEGDNWKIMLSVTTSLGVMLYVLERWD